MPLLTWLSNRIRRARIRRIEREIEWVRAAYDERIAGLCAELDLLRAEQVRQSTHRPARLSVDGAVLAVTAALVLPMLLIDIVERFA